MIVIIDYGVGNIRSVENSCRYIGKDVTISSDESVIKKATHLILPGVGAFRDAIGLLKKNNLDEIIKNEIKKNKPLLGICLGMQLLASISHEDGEHGGLDIINGSSVDRFDSSINLKIPHIGWNNVFVNDNSCPLFNGIENDSMFYFVHSYHMNVDGRYILSTTDYGYSFTSSVCKGNVYGVQFHPEKSSDVGLKLIENFCSL